MSHYERILRELEENTPNLYLRWKDPVLSAWEADAEIRRLKAELADARLLIDALLANVQGKEDIIMAAVAKLREMEERK